MEMVFTLKRDDAVSMDIMEQAKVFDLSELNPILLATLCFDFSPRGALVSNLLIVGNKWRMRHLE